MEFAFPASESKAVSVNCLSPSRIASSLSGFTVSVRWACSQHVSTTDPIPEMRETFAVRATYFNVKTAGIPFQTFKEAVRVQ